MTTAKENDGVYVKAEPASADLPVKVFKAELEAIKDRRENFKLPAVDDEQSSGPDVKRGLYGLALSGGGIRSSTFNLGVQQALERCGLLRHIDYLSTVSGGGYIGSCLSSYWAGDSQLGFDEVEISGIPEGCTLSKGKDLGDGKWRLAAGQLKELTLDLPLLEPDREYETVIKAIAIRKNKADADELREKRMSLPIRTRTNIPGGLKIESVDQDDTPCLAISGRLDSQDISVPLVLAPLYHFPFRHKDGKPESKEFRHLRDYSNYLTPPRPFAGLRLPGLFLRGLFINALLILPLLLFLAVATVFVAKEDIREALNTRQLEYLIDEADLQKARESEKSKLEPGDYQNVTIDLQSQIAWTPHEEDLDILLSGLPKDAKISLKNSTKPIAHPLGNGCWLLTNQDPDDLSYDLNLPGEKNFSLKVMAWESKKTTKLSGGAPWFFKKKPARTEMDIDRVSAFVSIFPWMLDVRKTCLRIEGGKGSDLRINGCKKDKIPYPPIKGNKVPQIDMFSLDLKPHIDWKKYIVLSGLPKNSYLIEGKFLDKRRWLFDGEAAQKLKLKIYVSDLHKDFTLNVRAWQSTDPNKAYQTVQGPKHSMELYYHNNKFWLKSSQAKDFSAHNDDVAAKAITLPTDKKIGKILKEGGIVPRKKTGENFYLKIANLPKGSILESNPPDVRKLSESKKEWVFMDNEIEDLAFTLKKTELEKLTKENPLQILAWQSGDDRGIYDPIELLYRDTFTITKWLLVFFAAALAFYPLLQKAMRMFGLKPWQRRDLLTRYVCGASIAVIIMVAFLEFQPLAIYLFYRMKGALTFAGILGGADKVLAIIGSILAATGGLFATRSMGQGSKLTAKIALNAMGLIGPAVLWLFYLNFCGWALASENVPEMFEHVEGYVLCVYLAVGLAIYLVSRCFYNINKSSFHPFYRDRLSKAFLIKTDQASGQVGHNDEQKLHDLDTRNSPLHIINSTLNVTGKSNVTLKGRTAEFFSFSRAYVGSQVTGYARTVNYEGVDNHMGLGTAMAISAAAAAPNMGRETNKSLTFIMALLNIRLGYWARNPLLMDPHAKKSFMKRLMGFVYPDQVGPIYLIKEMLGLINERSNFINLSDGGHLENMGLYELVRRRCKYIIVGDGEADKGMSFHGLSDAVRMVLIDMGIKIDIDLDRIYRDGNKDGCHYAVGTIHYGKDEEDEGYLLYIKSSVSKKHAPYIEDYMARNPDFPHETTADQFFDEAQFEAYRALGMEVGGKTRKELLSLDDNMTKEEAEAFWKDRKEWEVRALREWSKVLKDI